MQEIKKEYCALKDKLKAIDKEIERFQTRQADHHEKLNTLGAQLAEAEAGQSAMVKRFLSEEAGEDAVFNGQLNIDKLTSQKRSMEQIKDAIVAQITELQARRTLLNEQLLRDRKKFFDKIAKTEFAKIAEGLARSYAAHKNAQGGGIEFGNYVRESTQYHRDFFRDEALRAIADDLRGEYKI